MKDENNKEWAFKEITEKDFRRVSQLFKEAAIHLLFDNESPLLTLKEMFLLLGTQENFILNIVLDKA